VNALGQTIAEGAAHATGFAVLGLAVYLLLRRWSPAAGAQAALSILTVMALVWVLAWLPLPGWDLQPVLRLMSPASTGPAVAAGRAATVATDDGSPQKPVSNADPPPPVQGTLEAARSLLRALTDNLTGPPTVETHAAWGWRTWLAIAVLSCIGIGLVRLAAGLWAMRRLWLRSVPLDDAPLLDALALLRAEMGCVRPVGLRVTRDLVTPATIGVIRPMVLLPGDWQSWDETERRAVLAHELAHVCRGDFAAGLVAQLNLAIQFYHPLAHWILSRHRLDQELAADAWSARISGGNLPYLTVLARMALRQDDRSATWPARAFLPTRGTLVRRIEMLRSKRPIRHSRLSTPFRLLTLAALAGLGLLVAGLRSPMAAAPRGAEQEAVRPNPGPGDSRPAVGSFDLSLLPAETRVVLAVQPAAILGRPEMAPLLKAFEQFSRHGANQPVAPESVDQMLVFWEGNVSRAPAGRAASLGPSGFIVRVKNPQAAKALLDHLLPGAEPMRHSGQAYYRPVPGRGGPDSMSAFLPDDHTVVLASQDLLLTLIEDRNAPAPAQSWDEAWKQAEKGPIAAAVDARWLRREYNRVMADAPAGPGPGHPDPRVELISPLLEKVQSYALGVSLDGNLRCDLVARTGRAEDVKPVSDTIQAVLTLARNAIPSLRQSVPGENGPAAEVKSWAVTLLSTLVEKASLESAGQMLHVRSSAPLEKDSAARVASLLVGRARFAADRTVSQNNLKQIGLAFHNYADANGHFPNSAVAKSGKPPYSWRVALLPYLEEQQLYSAYNFDEPWDGPNNSKLLDKMPAVYAFPELGARGRTHTSYFAFSGPDAILGQEGGTPFADITDGTSNTILVVEAKRAVPWTKPEDIAFDPNGPLPQVGGYEPEGFNALFGDGSVRFIKGSILPHIFKALITRKGGEVIGIDSF
jgi:hypothetical protein